MRTNRAASLVNTTDQSIPEGHRNYVVSLATGDDYPPAADRRSRRTQVVNHNMQAGRSFRDRLTQAVMHEGLQGDLWHVGEPMSLPFVHVVGTPRLADVMRHMQGVSGVIEDQKSEGVFDVFTPVKK